MAKLFFSYSHKDEAIRDELEIHLSILKREGKIEVWHDRRIGVGKELSKEIDSNLEESDIVLLLVSPYFLDSYYCYEIELQRALEKHQKGELRVIPVILETCDWQHSIFRHLLAVPKDGKPISKYPNQHDAFLEVVTCYQRRRRRNGGKKRAAVATSNNNRTDREKSYIDLVPATYESKKPSPKKRRTISWNDLMNT